MEQVNKCRWCETPITTSLLDERKDGSMYLYDACDTDCMKAMKIIDKTDISLNTYSRLRIEPTPYGICLDDGTEQDEKERQDLKIDINFDDIKLGETDEPENRFDVL